MCQEETNNETELQMMYWVVSPLWHKANNLQIAPEAK